MCSGKANHTNSIDSAIGRVQCSSEKSEISLNTGSSVLNTFHITLRNFSNESRRCHIMENRIARAYLPVRYDASHTGDAECNSVQHMPSSCMEILITIHESTVFSLKNIRQTSLVGPDCSTADGTRICFHLMISANVGNISECKDLLSVKQRYWSALSYHSCLISKKDFYGNK